MTNHEELARFSANSKTFFFNKMKARNDSEYLSINAIWGQGNKQRMTLFPSQLLDFHKNLSRAIEKMTGLSPAGSKAMVCPKCDMPKRTWHTLSNSKGQWVLYCSECREVCDAFIDDHDAAIEAMREADDE